VIDKTSIQANAEVSTLIEKSLYTLISSTLLGIINTATLLWFPLLFSAYNLGGVLAPTTVLIMGFILYQTYVCWTMLCNHADVPSTSMLLQEMMFVMQRTPINLTKETFWLRIQAFATRGLLIACNIFGTTLGIYIVTLRKGTIIDTNTDKSNIGQPEFDNDLLSHDTMMFAVAAQEFIRSLVNIHCYLGSKTELRIWPKYDHDQWVAQSPYKAGIEAAIAMFTIPLTGGFVNYEYVWATAMVSGSPKDTGIFSGMLIVGSMLALLVSWLMYTFPKFQNMLTYKRFDLLVKSLFKSQEKPFAFGNPSSQYMSFSGQ